ncbi:unnamed protein product [Linum trigynum]|uniref:Uncharacterized protein n=1 Tax=Linum trigynum TaxID=586398 RepID=A0AAV2DFH4_9ROSI
MNERICFANNASLLNLEVRRELAHWDVGQIPYRKLLVLLVVVLSLILLLTHVSFSWIDLMDDSHSFSQFLHLVLASGVKRTKQQKGGSTTDGPYTTAIAG